VSNDTEALRMTSDSLLDDLEALEALEEEKRNVALGSHRLVELATQIEELAHRVLAGALGQRQLSQEVQAAAATGQLADPESAIADTREIKLILADWRDAERRLAEAAPGSAAAASVEAEIERLRGEYRTAFDEARRRDV